MTGHSVEHRNSLTNRACALSSYALTCAAPITLLVVSVINVCGTSGGVCRHPYHSWWPGMLLVIIIITPGCGLLIGRCCWLLVMITKKTGSSSSSQ